MSSPESGRILAVDYGEKRVGLAVSDPLGIIAGGAGTFVNDAGLLTRIQEYVEREGVVRIIVGMPLTLKGERGKTAEAVQKFIDKLAAALSVPVEGLDERFTSSIAERTIREMGIGKKNRRERKDKIDEIAAVYLLQGWLDGRSSG